MDTAVRVVISKCKSIPSINTVVFVVFEKLSCSLGSKLGLGQKFTKLVDHEI